MFISGFPLRLAALTAAVLLVAPAASAQPVLFVDTDATGAADGSSWADAFPDLQDALAVAEAGDEVWVAEGMYRPALTADRDAAFVLVSGVGLYGGFDGTETERDERDVEANVTVLSGEIGDPGEISDNAYHVVTASGVDESTILDGFTVTGGYGNGVNPRNRGGGIYAENSSLVVRECRIVENTVIQTDGFGGGGGAFFGTSGTPHFEGVVFERNGLNALGGGVWLYREVEAGVSAGAGWSPEARARRAAEVLVRRGAVLGEEDASGGGASGMYVPDARHGAFSAVFRDVSFVENRSSFGGGMSVNRATIDLVGATFVRNFASEGSGGLRISGAEGRLVNVGFYGNMVGDSFVGGGGGMNGFASFLALTNVAFAGNAADFAGGLGLGGGGTSVLTNVTFAANEATIEGGGVRLANGVELDLRNGVFWENTIDGVDATSGFAALSHTLLAEGCPPDASGEAECEALLDADPEFVRDPDPGPDGTWGTADDDYGDLRLREGSPAVDFGLSEFLPPDTFDLDADGDTEEPLPLDLAGEPRVMGPGVDLGAYEGAVAVAAEEGASVSEASLDVYPNPARGPVAVSFRLERAQPVAVEVFDALGRRVAVLHRGPLPAGSHGLRLGTARLTPGVYLVRLRSATVSRTRPLAILR